MRDTLSPAPIASEFNFHFFTVNGRMWVTARASTNTEIYFIFRRGPTSVHPGRRYGDQNARPLPWMQISRQREPPTVLLRDVFITSVNVDNWFCHWCIFASDTRPKRCIPSPLLCLHLCNLNDIGTRAHQLRNSLTRWSCFTLKKQIGPGLNWRMSQSIGLYTPSPCV